MILTEKHIGVKVRRAVWASGSYFVPTEIETTALGNKMAKGIRYHDDGASYSDRWNIEAPNSWELFREPEVKEPFFLTESHIGVKVCLPHWEEGKHFIPSESQEPNSDEAVRGTMYDKNGKSEHHSWFNDEDWYLYREPETKAPEGLSLQEAMASGKDFRPIGGEYWCFTAPHGTVIIRHESSDVNAPLNLNFINARYELKPDPKKVEITAAQLEKVWKECIRQGGVSDWLPYLKRELGLDE